EVQFTIRLIHYVRLSQNAHLTNFLSRDVIHQTSLLLHSIIEPKLQVRDVIRLALQATRGVGQNSSVCGINDDLGVDHGEVDRREEIFETRVYEIQPAIAIKLDTARGGTLGIDERTLVRGTWTNHGFD